MVKLKVVFRHLSGRTEEKREKTHPVAKSRFEPRIRLRSASNSGRTSDRRTNGRVLVLHFSVSKDAKLCTVTVLLYFVALRYLSNDSRMDYSP